MKTGGEEEGRNIAKEKRRQDARATAGPAQRDRRTKPSTAYCGLRTAPPCCCASLTFADSSFFCTPATSRGSTSLGMVLLQASSARSQWAAASLRRPVFW